MAPDERLLERVRAALAGRDDVVEKRMVGGRSCMVGGHLCCGVTGDALMVRVGPASQEAALADPNVRPMALGGRQGAVYVLVDPAGCATDSQLRSWIQRGLDFVAGLATD
jgi:TfoX/Sxy family transcriptional regulator of competence genes